MYANKYSLVIKLTVGYWDVETRWPCWLRMWSFWPLAN